MPLKACGRILHLQREAATIATMLDNHRRLGMATYLMGHYLWIAGQPTQAVTCAPHAADIAASLEDVGLQIMAHTYLGLFQHSLGHDPQAIASLTRHIAALAGPWRHGLLAMTGLPVALSRVWLAWCLAEGGVFSEAIVYGEEGIELAEIVDHPYSLIHACCGLGFVCLRQGDLPRAVGVLERAHTLAQTYAPVALPVTTAHRGYALALAGRGTEAVPLLEYAVEQSVATHLLFYHSLRVAWLGEALLLIGRMPEAADHAVRALGLSRERQEQGHEAWAVRLRGAIAAPSDSPDVATAEIHDHHALTRAQTPGMRQLQTHCHRGLGALYGYLGRPAQARSALSAAIELDRTMSMTYWLLPAQATLAQSV